MQTKSIYFISLLDKHDFKNSGFSTDVVFKMFRTTLIWSAEEWALEFPTTPNLIDLDSLHGLFKSRWHRRKIHTANLKIKIKTTRPCIVGAYTMKPPQTGFVTYSSEHSLHSCTVFIDDLEYTNIAFWYVCAEKEKGMLKENVTDREGIERKKKSSSKDFKCKWIIRTYWN